MAKTVTGGLTLPIERAVGDFETLGMVFGWLDAMLGSIEDATKKEGSSLESRLLRVTELANCGRYLATDWQATTESMADALRDALNEQTEAGHGE